MTTEENGNDPRVSEEYRAIATETTPPELDSKILSMAADEARPRYGLARAWSRPLAWAATIGLSLAFVLEMSQLGDVNAPVVDADIANTLEERVVEDQAAGRTSDVSQLRQELDKRSDAPAAAKVGSPAAAEPEPALDGTSVSDDFAASDMSLLREAEEQARARSGPARAVAVDAEIAAFAEKKEQLEYCDSAARLSASTWYACIKDLRESGQADDADRELEALHLKFPDFADPDGYR